MEHHMRSSLFIAWKLLKLLSIVLAASSSLISPMEAEAEGFPIVFSVATDQQFEEFSQACVLGISQTEQDEFAKMRFYNLFRSHQNCRSGIHGEYCPTYFWHFKSGRCSLVIYTKWNGMTGDLTNGIARATPLVLQLGGSDISPVFFEAAGGTVAVSENEQFIELLNVEN